MQLDPVLSASGFCVLTATKKPPLRCATKSHLGDGLGGKTQSSDILAICHLIDSTQAHWGKNPSLFLRITTSKKK